MRSSQMSASGEADWKRKQGALLAFVENGSSYCAEIRHGPASSRWCSRRQKARSCLEGLAPLLMVTGSSEGQPKRAQREMGVGRVLNGHFRSMGWNRGRRMAWPCTLGKLLDDALLLAVLSALHSPGALSQLFKRKIKESSDDRTRAQGEKKSEKQMR